MGEKGNSGNLQGGWRLDLLFRAQQAKGAG